jgi:hypothetical protein
MIMSGILSTIMSHVIWLETEACQIRFDILSFV